jgi:hypothetical protein
LVKLLLVTALKEVTLIFRYLLLGSEKKISLPTPEKKNPSPKSNNCFATTYSTSITKNLTFKPKITVESFDMLPSTDYVTSLELAKSVIVEKSLVKTSRASCIKN